METRRFGRLGYEVSAMALGTWGLSGDAYGPVYTKEVDKVIDLAVELGITLFETADVYGDGEMEKKLGQRLDPKQTRVVTKIGTFLDEKPARKRFDEPSLRRSFSACQKRLKRDRIDTVLLHNPTAATVATSDGVDYLKQLVEEGQVDAWGVSAGSPEVARAAISRGADVIELGYNFFVAHELHQLTDELAANVTAVLARSALAHGLLAGKWSVGKAFLGHDHRSKRWTQPGLRRRLAQLEALEPLVSGDVGSLRAAALRFVLSNQLVTSVVLGPRSVIQLRELVEDADDGPPYFDEEALIALPELLASVGLEV